MNKNSGTDKSSENEREIGKLASEKKSETR